MVKIRVGVIGAGAAGLVAGRFLVHSPDRFEFVILEQASDVGGTWTYSDENGNDDDGVPIHSSMYKSLTTILPKEIMGFRDFPFPESWHSYISHTLVLQYLKDYATKHGLYDKIKFRSRVKSVTPVELSEGRVWKIRVTELDSKIDKDYEFDSVMVCSGHYSAPYIPVLEGIEQFSGWTAHSHNYRVPEAYKDRTVVVLGASSSGMDIAMELSYVAKEVFLSHNLPRETCPLPSKLKQVPGIKRAHADGFTFLDDTRVKADALLYCTGYSFDFPFLDEKCKVRVEENQVKPMYKHLIHMDYHELCFVGLPTKILAFPFFEIQIQYFLKTLDETIKLPSRIEMEAENERDFNKRVVGLKWQPKYAHRMLGDLQWEYLQDLADSAQVESLPLAWRKVYDWNNKEKKRNIMGYKKDEYKILNDMEFTCSNPEK